MDGNIGDQGEHDDNAYQVVLIDNGTRNSGTELDRLTIRNGRADRIDPFSLTPLARDYIGAGVLVIGGTPRFTDCNFYNNHAGSEEGGYEPIDDDLRPELSVAFGGAVAAYEAAPTFEGCIFVGNLSGTGGGAIGIYTQKAKVNDVLIASCEFYDNGPSIS